jgi:nucleoside permease NupC
VAANVFLGMIESPIVIRAYLDKLSRSEVFLMMVVGLATVAGSTMVAYATILSPVLTNAAGHVLVASIVSAPAGILLARVIIPEKPGEGGAVADGEDGEQEPRLDGPAAEAVRQADAAALAYASRRREPTAPVLPGGSGTCASSGPRISHGCTSSSCSCATQQ